MIRRLLGWSRRTHLKNLRQGARISRITACTFPYLRSPPLATSALPRALRVEHGVLCAMQTTRSTATPPVCSLNDSWAV